MYENSVKKIKHEPSSDDRLTAWVGEPGSPIKREGKLDKIQVADATVAYQKNGLDLLSDARLLLFNDRIERGSALVILALEELAKVKILIETFMNHESKVDQAAWKKYWKTGGSHKYKQKEILSYGQVIKAEFGGNTENDRYLYRFYAPEDTLQKLDWFKQKSFYVDIREDGVHAPGVNENFIKATDYLLAFAQERADSYMSWHISQRRTLDLMQQTLEKNNLSYWTRSFRKQEVEADLIYILSALSAPRVPDYTIMYDNIENYLQRKVALNRVKAALLNVASEMRLRIIQTEKLPIYQGRYIGAHKLLFGIATNNIFNQSFNSKLQEVLKI